MLAEVKPDVAVISTRLDKIAAIAIEAANAGCHLICEKPLALTHESLKNVHRAIKESKVELFAMHSMRSEGAFITAHNLYQNGEIGDPIRGATLTGNGPKVLQSIDRVGNDLGFGIGTCGKDGQGTPVGDAQPTLRIPEIVVGGTSKK